MPSGMRRSPTILPASRLNETTFPVLASKTTTPTGDMFISVSQVSPGPLLVPVPAGVGDDQRRLGREHDQNLFVFARELPPRFLLRHVEVADALAPVEDRRRQKGHDRPHGQGRAELGKAKRPDVAEQVREPQRLRDAAEVFEEPHPVGARSHSCRASSAVIPEERKSCIPP